VFFNPQGEMVACVTLWDNLNPTHPWVEWEIVPNEPHWQDIVRGVIAWAEQRALQSLARCEPGERFGPHVGYDASRPEILALVESLGYQPIRYHYRMGITMHEPPVIEPLPDGFTLKTFDYPSELEAVIAAKEEMWRDHYGYVELPLSERVEGWRATIENDAKFDATLWYIATDDTTGEIAGLVLGRPEDFTKADQGYILVVGVRKAYRRRGLAQAMMTHAFAEYWRRGQKMVALSVDASNPTGATRLYERVGMSPIQRFARMEKEMRPGIERMNTGRSS
jgi:mycothiol synthase